jgi:hypothetical protein
VRFGSASARVISWTTTKIVVVVPNLAWPSRTSDELEVQVTVTPKGGVASRGVEFEIKR